MKLKIQICLVVSIIITIPFTGCKKEFLGKKPNTGIVVPITLSDMTQLLDNDEPFYRNGSSLGILSADEYYYASLDTYNSTTTKTVKNTFIWSTDVFGGETKISDWNYPYLSIFYANIVLDQWEKLPVTDQSSTQGKYVKAWALFCRSYAFYNLVQLFSPAYNSATAARDLGVPLKLSANINDIQKRSTVQETYDRILSDLESSIPLYTDIFPDKTPIRASKAGTYALLARIYLSMGKYPEALSNAEKCLVLKNDLIDYNTIDISSATPFSKFNIEILQYSISTVDYSALGVGPFSSLLIDPALINLYSTGDLRKDIFYRSQNGNFLMNYMYAGDAIYPFTGLAVDEVYLIKAECLARNGKFNDAMDVLNHLLIKRYKFDPITNQSTYVKQTANSPEDALQKILLERRKELVWRGLRWSDLKRLNIGGANITLTRSLGGKTYTLPPNDPRYVMPIPDDEIALSHIQQNIR